MIDVALRKDIAADGSRHVRAVDDDDERGRRSITLVRVAQRFAGFSLLDVTLKTGRTHQIRVHLADAGHAIAGDPKYGDFALNRALARGQLVASLRFDRMFLHARRLRFVHPASGEPIELEAPLPAACEALLDALAPARPERRVSYARRPASSACAARRARLQCDAVVAVRARSRVLDGDCNTRKGIHIMKTKLLAIASAAALAVGAITGCSTTTTSTARRRRPDGQAPGIDANVDGALSRLYAQDPSSRELIAQGARRARLPVDRLGRLRRRRLVRPGRAARARPHEPSTTAPPPARSACSPAPSRRRSTCCS